MHSAVYEPEYLEGIRCFNARDFFEAHEAWEAVWVRTTGHDRLFYKGLIHAAVALHHFGNGNLRGAHKVIGSCLQYLGPYMPRHLGLDVQQFVAQLRRCFARLEAAGEAGGERLDESLIPDIVVDPTPAADE
jgi:predicted metal-dependent hydrolase